MNSDMEVAFLEVDMYFLAQEEISSDLSELQTFENCDWACAVDYFGKLVKRAATEGFSVCAWLANFAGKGENLSKHIAKISENAWGCKETFEDCPKIL